MNDTRIDPNFEERVRRSLHAIADTVEVDTARHTVTSLSRSRAQTAQRRKRLALVAGAVVVPLTVAAAAVVNVGPEYVDQIAPEDIVTEGSIDGSRYLLTNSDDTDSCGNPETGITLVEESKNPIGSEWTTSLFQYGDYADSPCGPVLDNDRYLTNPALYNDSGSPVGDSLLWVYGVHPDVTEVRITSGDFTQDLPIFEVDGAGYAPFEIPTDMESYTSELFIDGQPVPGSSEVQEVPAL